MVAACRREAPHICIGWWAHRGRAVAGSCDSDGRLRRLVHRRQPPATCMPRKPHPEQAVADEDVRDRLRHSTTKDVCDRLRHSTTKDVRDRLRHSTTVDCGIARPKMSPLTAA